MQNVQNKLKLQKIRQDKVCMGKFLLYYLWPCLLHICSLLKSSGDKLLVTFFFPTSSGISGWCRLTYVPLGLESQTPRLKVMRTFGGKDISLAKWHGCVMYWSTVAGTSTATSLPIFSRAQAAARGTHGPSPSPKRRRAILIPQWGKCNYHRKHQQQKTCRVKEDQIKSDFIYITHFIQKMQLKVFDNRQG